jgi:antirestriction protein
MSEREPEQQRQQSDRQEPDSGPWNPDEQVGDDGSIRHVEAEPKHSDEDSLSAEQQPKYRPSIWVGSWSDYNNGRLHGDWIAADREDDAIWADIRAMLARSPTARQTGEAAEEWGIFDAEDFGPLRIGEQESITWVSKVARGIAEHGLAYAAYADVMQDEQALAGFEDDYLGQFDSTEAYVEQLVADVGYDELLDRVVPEQLRPYVRIDVAALARDMQLGGDIHVVPTGEGGVWIFAAR